MSDELTPTEREEIHFADPDKVRAIVERIAREDRGLLDRLAEYDGG